MKNLVLASLIALAASQAAGCIITTGDDDDGGPLCPVEGGNITANWQIKSAVTGTVLGCPAGYHTAALYSQAVNADGTPVGSPIVDLFDCECGTGTTALSPGLYQMWVEITTDNNSDVYAKSLSAFVDLSTGSKTFSAEILDDGGYFQLQWGLVDAANNNAPLTCAQAGADGVEAIGALVSNPDDANSDIFECTDQYGVTAGYTAGTYTVSIHAVNAADQQLGDSVVLENKVIEGPNLVTDLGTVMVPID